MSGTNDEESKTEEPTEKKINEALEKGRIPVSRELSTVAGVLSLLICLRLPGLSGILCAGRVDHHVVTKRPSNMMANWFFASPHSRGGIFHSPAT